MDDIPEYDANADIFTHATWHDVKDMVVDGLRDVCVTLAKHHHLVRCDLSGASIFYILLGDIAIVTSIYKDVGSNKLHSFLMNDFSQTRWKQAAGTHAHVSVQRKDYKMAVVMFLLSGSLESAVSTCLDSLNDPMLALFVARVASRMDDGVQEKRVVDIGVKNGERPNPGLVGGIAVFTADKVNADGTMLSANPLDQKTDEVRVTSGVAPLCLPTERYMMVEEEEWEKSVCAWIRPEDELAVVDSPPFVPAENVLDCHPAESKNLYFAKQSVGSGRIFHLSPTPTDPTEIGETSLSSPNDSRSDTSKRPSSKVFIVFSILGDGDGYPYFVLENVFGTFSKAEESCKNLLAARSTVGKTLNPMNASHADDQRIVDELSSKGYILGHGRDMRSLSLFYGGFAGFLIEKCHIQ